MSNKYDKILGAYREADGGTLDTSTATSFTAGSVIFVGSDSTLQEDNANFFWDDANNQLGLGTASPQALFHLNKSAPTFLITDPGLTVPSVFGRPTTTAFAFSVSGAGIGGAYVWGQSSSGAPGMTLWGIGGGTRPLLLSGTKVSAGALTALADSEILLQVENVGSAGAQSGTKVNTFLGDGSFGIGSASTAPGAMLQAISSATTRITQINKNIASQTANVYEAQNSSGTAYVSIGPATLATNDFTSNWLRVNGTLPVSTAAAASFVNAITPTDTTNSNEYVAQVVWLDTSSPGGYTGFGYTIANYVLNQSKGTGTGVSGNQANYGLYCQAVSTTVGTNIGAYYDAGGGNINIGMNCQTIRSKNSAKNIGVIGAANNTGTSPVVVGGWFHLSANPSVPTVSSVILADNTGTTSADIARFQSGGVIKTTITNDGTVTSPGAGGSLSEHFGASSVASGTNGATAIGNTATASGNYSSAYGYNAQATGIAATAIGNLSQATADNTVALGQDARATSAYSIAIGLGSRSINAGGYGIAIGENSNAGSSGTAIGAAANASGDGSFALGTSTTGSGTNSVAIGGSAVASGFDSIAIGLGANNAFQGSIAIGRYSTPTANTQLVMGNTASGYNINDIYIGGGVTSTAPTATTYNGTGASGSNVAAADIVIAGGKATGNAAGGSLLFKTSDAGSTGTTLQSLTTKMSILASGNVSLVKLISTYNNIATAAWGVPAIYGSGRSTAQTGDVASVATYTVGASDGSFLISANFNVTAYTAGTQSVQCTYTDETNTARTFTFTFSNLTGTLATAIGATGPYESFIAHIRVKASTAITIKTVGTAWVGTYNVEGIISQIT